jgi:citrate lyase subunit beta/citryl-CoA lyase
MSLARTYLFVPGDRPERFEKALSSGADAVILDLEDAVAPAAKEAARQVCERWLLEHRDALAARQVLVRINDAGTPWYSGDRAMVAQSGLCGVMLPKTETREQLLDVRAVLAPGQTLVALVESARGLAAIEAIAETAGLSRIAFGTLDYALDLDLSGDERGLIEPCSRIAIASRAAGISPPIAGVTADLQDEGPLLRDLAFVRAFGFSAKLCIHPRQIEPIHRALAPSDTELDWAQRVLAAAQAAGSGAVQVDGRMVDRPVLARAQQLIARAR